MQHHSFFKDLSSLSKITRATSLKIGASYAKKLGRRFASKDLSLAKDQQIWHSKHGKLLLQETIEYW